VEAFLWLSIVIKQYPDIENVEGLFYCHLNHICQISVRLSGIFINLFFCGT
jgi:hypothetical protein